LLDYEAVIIAGPRRKFTEKDKFAIDQYIMHGGKVMWFIDAVTVHEDSLALTGTTLAYMNDLNLRDQLFSYGVRINPELVKDLHCNQIVVEEIIPGGHPKKQLKHWLYSPILNPPDNHAVTRDLNLLKTDFINTIDTLGGNGDIQKTILLTSTPYTRIAKAPMVISLEEAFTKVDSKEFKGGPKPVAVLLEGSFNSVFKNRMINKYLEGDNLPFEEQSPNTKLLVVADGDMIRNEVVPTSKGLQPLRLGYDKNTNQEFGNRDFIMNALHYLTDEAGLMELRAKEFKLRLLNHTKIKKQKLHWQLINVLGPVIVILLMGFGMAWYRKRKYSY
jgi:ABC-2 type transport system permease protein